MGTAAAVPPGSTVMHYPATSAALTHTAQASSSSSFSLLPCCLPGGRSNNFVYEDRIGNGPRPPPLPTATKPPEKIDPANGHHWPRPCASKSFNASYRSVAPSPRGGVTFDQA